MKKTNPCTKKNRLDSEIEYRVLHGLALEWRTALWVLPHHVAASMKQPVFSLKTGDKTLAHWDALKREISFSRHFVLNYPWDAIREVLIHEMAHQYTSEVLTITDETAHGPGFISACHILKANPKASGSYKPLTDRLACEEYTDHDRIMVKIKKLMALGESGNRHEAEAAVAKAHHMILKFNVDMMKKESDRHFISVFVGKPSLRHSREEYMLARLLVDHYFVFGIWVSAFVLEKGKMGRVFEITGSSENVKIAAYVHDFMTRHMDMAWDSFNVGKTLNRSRKSDFTSGLIDGFRSKLITDQTRTKPRVKPSSNVLPVVLHDPALKDYASFKYPRISHFKRRASNCDADLINKGKKIGEKLVLAKGLEKHHQGRMLSLPDNSLS